MNEIIRVINIYLIEVVKGMGLATGVAIMCLILRSIFHIGICG